MSREKPNQEWKIQDCKELYEVVGTMGASLIVILVILSLVLKQFELALPSDVWYMPGFMFVFLSYRIDAEVLIRMGFKRIFFFYLISGQVLCLFPGLLLSTITPSATPDDPIILWTGMGIVYAMIAIGMAAYRMKKFTG